MCLNHGYGTAFCKMYEINVHKYYHEGNHYNRICAIDYDLFHDKETTTKYGDNRNKVISLVYIQRTEHYNLLLCN